MGKLNLNEAADRVQMASSELSMYYNTETGEFDFYSEDMDMDDEVDTAKFEEAPWIPVPDRDTSERYHMMVEFVETVTDPHKNEILSVALEGKGAFRRFKDTLHRVNLIDEWYAFEHQAYVEIAREWCEENGIEYFV